METNKIDFHKASIEDLKDIEAIRKKAFQPIFDSFRKILGDTIYETAQKPEDEAQEALLASYFKEGSVWQTWEVIGNSHTVGFFTLRLDRKSKVGEIGLNAIDPDFSGKGAGTRMYEFALNEMRRAGMKVATVATGGDPSHLPARKAYRSAGFNVEIPSVWMCQEL